MEKDIKEKIINIFKQPLIYVLLFCIFVQVKIYNTVPNYVMTSDSYTYAEKYNTSILRGQVNELRTPVYPYFIKAIGKISGQENLYNSVAMAQKILFIITLILFYFCLKKITKSNIITSVLTIVFGICPFILLWNIMILTEAISIFESILLSFVTILYLEKPKKSTAIILGIIVLGMILTRPSFIYLLPIYFLFWILRLIFNKKEKEVIAGIISCAVCSVILLGYCGLMKMQYGEFSITAVSYINNTITAINSNSYKQSGNEEMIKFVDEIKGDRSDGEICWTALDKLKEQYSVEEIKNFANTSLKNDKNYLKFIISKTVQLGSSNIGTASYIPNDVFINEKYANQIYNEMGNIILPINFAMVYMIVGIAIIYILYDLAKNKNINWYLAFFTVLIAANIFTLIVGAPFESQRLFASSIVQVLLLIGYVVAKGIYNKKIN